MKEEVACVEMLDQTEPAHFLWCQLDVQEHALVCIRVDQNPRAFRWGGGFRLAARSCAGGKEHLSVWDEPQPPSEPEPLAPCIYQGVLDSVFPAFLEPSLAAEVCGLSDPLAEEVDVDVCSVGLWVSITAFARAPRVMATPPLCASNPVVCGAKVALAGVSVSLRASQLIELS